MTWRYWLIAALVVAVLVAAIYVPALKRRLTQSAQVPEKSAEEARRELAQPSSSAGDPIAKAELFWSSGAEDGSLTPVEERLDRVNDALFGVEQVIAQVEVGEVPLVGLAYRLFEQANGAIELLHPVFSHKTPYRRIKLNRQPPLWMA